MAVSVAPGYRVGPWEVREPIASGAFGTVYAGRRAKGAPGDPVDVALKFLATGTRTPRQLRHLQELAEREVNLHSRLRGPRLIRMHETLTVDDPATASLDGATMLVLEKADTSLDTVLSRTPRPEDGPSLLAQICEGLLQLHRAGWVHGDLKPGNVLLMPDRTVRLGDFGLASELHGTHGYAPAFHTADYTPPELLWAEIGEQGRQIRASADIWAYGVMAHLVLAGSFPLPGSTPATRRDAVVQYARGHAELRLSPELPDAWREIITDCLAPTHEARAGLDAAALLRRVAALAGTKSSASLLRRPFGRRGPRRPGAAARWGLGAVAATLAVTLSAFMLRDTATENAARGYERCPASFVCFFAERDGHGDMCAWSDDEKDWQSGSVVCAWGRTSAPKSAFNNGTPDPLIDVQYFEQTEYGRLEGCLENKESTNLDGGALVRSSKWVAHC
ncbi:serine/threonine-protein kinase [Streptomyces formicae]